VIWIGGINTLFMRLFVWTCAAMYSFWISYQLKFTESTTNPSAWLYQESFKSLLSGCALVNHKTWD
jgi:hypothetical protein